MSWDTVNASITFSSPINPFGLFNPDEQQTIRDIIKATYDLSPTLNNLLETWTASDHQINIYKTGPFTPGQGGPGNGLLGLNLDAITHTFFFNKTGHLVNDIPNLIIAHELFHAIRNTEDLVGTGPFGLVTNADLNSPSFDYDGERYVCKTKSQTSWGSTIGIRSHTNREYWTTNRTTADSANCVPTLATQTISR